MDEKHMRDYIFVPSPAAPLIHNTLCAFQNIPRNCAAYIATCSSYALIVIVKFQNEDNHQTTSMTPSLEQRGRRLQRRRERERAHRVAETARDQIGSKNKGKLADVIGA